MNKILIIGDKLGFSYGSIQNLKKEYEVDQCDYVSTALVLIKRQKYAMIIIDVITFSADIYDMKETSDGLMTGIVFYKRELAKLGIPVILCILYDEFKELVEQIDNPIVKFVVKNTDEHCLTEAVEDLLKVKTCRLV